jgi:hypothetical protein
VLSQPAVRVTPNLAGPTLGLGRATARELLRRPGVHLATLATGALIATLHELGAATFGATPALALELTLTTCAVFLSLVAGVAGVRAASREDELGPTAAIAAAPLGWGGYAVGRLGGITATAGVLLLALLAFSAAGQLVSGGSLPAPSAALLTALSGVLLQAALLAAVGFALASALPPALALIGTLGLLVVARTVLPAIVGSGGAVGSAALLLPDPLRMDFAREAAASMPISTTSALLAAGSAALHVAAFAIAGAAGLASRERH